MSARRLRKEYDSHIRRYLWGGHFWSGSYFAGSCGGTADNGPADIENQKRPV
ncbi:transposase [Streptomyces sp. NPDC048350]|uniref:transposase n=1 Tax=Streptomyces sp. NPDC048350 TaxID=3365538 RepID=UPI00371B39B0